MFTFTHCNYNWKVFLQSVVTLVSAMRKAWWIHYFWEDAGRSAANICLQEQGNHPRGRFNLPKSLKVYACGFSHTLEHYDFWNYTTHFNASFQEARICSSRNKFTDNKFCLFSVRGAYFFQKSGSKKNFCARRQHLPSDF